MATLIRLVNLSGNQQNSESPEVSAHHGEEIIEEIRMERNPDELEVLKIVVQRLDKAGIPYMVTGSIAGNFYSQPRMTRDIDVVIKMGINQIDSLYSLLRDDFYVDRNSMEEALANRSMFNVIHSEKVVKIDLIVIKPGEYREVEFSRRVKRKVNNSEVFVVSPEDLILSKLHWAKESRSDTQLGDVRNIIALNKDALDFQYLGKWAQELSVLELLEEAQG